MEGMVRPPPPKHPFDMSGPTLEKLYGRVKRKKNGAKPGPNGLNYVVYKKLPAVLFKLLNIFERVHQLKRIPAQWGIANMILLAKYDNVSTPGPIPQHRDDRL
jgi:hypothetical protein